MKQTITLFALVIALASCGGNSTTTPATTDSTTVIADTVKVDSTVIKTEIGRAHV